MTAVVLHIVQTFQETGGGVVAVTPRSFRSAAEPQAAAQILMQTHSGVVAWWRHFDPDAGEYGEPEDIMRSRSQT